MPAGNRVSQLDEWRMKVDRNKTSTLNRNRKAIAGIGKHYANLPTIILHGVPVTPADVVTILQDQIDAADATAAAKIAFFQATSAERNANAKANDLFKALKTRVLGDFANQAEVLADFGMTVATRRAPDPATLVEAAKKAEATRKARHTMGKRQKAAIKGTVPTTPSED